MLSGNFAHYKRTKKVEHSKKVSDFGAIEESSRVIWPHLCENLQNMSMKLILFVYFAIHNTVKAMLN